MLLTRGARMPYISRMCVKQYRILLVRLSRTEGEATVPRGGLKKEKEGPTGAGSRLR